MDLNRKLVSQERMNELVTMVNKIHNEIGSTKVTNIEMLWVAAMFATLFTKNTPFDTECAMLAVNDAADYKIKS